MGTYIIKTPDIGEGIAEVELVAWHVKVGDTVQMDQVLADVMTEKATVEVPSPVAGVVLALAGTVGHTVAVGAELVRLEVEGAGNLKDAAAKVAAPTRASAPTPVAATVAVAPMPAAVSAAPAVMSHQPASAAPFGQGRAIASPAVRRRAWELGIDLQAVTPTGTAGRITHADLDAWVAAYPTPSPRTKPELSAAGPLPRREGPPGGQRPHEVGKRGGDFNPDVAATDTIQDIPVIGLRRKIAMKMQDAKRRIPHFSYVEEVDVTELEALRERLNAQWGGERGRLTVLPLLVRAMVLALQEFPQINARFDDDKGIVTRHSAVHLGVAAQTDNGLMVPVLRHAQARDLWGNGAEIARLAEAARTGRATREELSGSTITLSSLGALGGIVSTPVINHPEVAIVGVNRMVERPVFWHGQVVARKMMNLSSSFDHRVVDGMDAARFIQAVKGYLETPATLFVG